MSVRGVLAVLVAATLLGGVAALAVLSQQHRFDRLEAAEVKYGAEYLKAVRDGEGGGLWRFAGGSTLSCRISGPRNDPALGCGADGHEPPVSAP